MSDEKERRFGDVIHEARLDKRPPLSLRRFAVQLDIAAPYLSKIENNMDRPPSARVVEHMAEILGLGKHELLLLADRIPTEFEETFRQNQRAPDFMRIGVKSGYTPEELEDLIKKSKAKKPR